MRLETSASTPALIEHVLAHPQRENRALGSVRERAPRGGSQLYIPVLAYDSFFDLGYRFNTFLSTQARPSFADLVEFVIDDGNPDSVRNLPTDEIEEFRSAIRAFWGGWNSEYHAALGRAMTRTEKFHLLRGWIRCASVSRERFYRNKKVVAREEWFVRWGHWEDRVWRAGGFARVRTFARGSADAWIPGIGLLGFSRTAKAYREVSDARYRRWEEVENQLFDGRFLPPPPPPETFAPDDATEPFSYEG